MLARLIIGGIALAATGYGLKKYFYNNEFIDIYNSINNNNKGMTPEEKAVQRINLAHLRETVKLFEEEKQKLTKTSLIELNNALAEIKDINIDFDTQKVERHKYKFKIVNEKLIEEIQEFTTLLIQTEIFISSSFYALDNLIIDSSSFNTYSNENKELINKLLQVSNLIDKINNSSLTYDGKFISRECKRAFKQLKQVID